MKKLYWKTMYHGTNKKGADIIMKDGFKRGTFFSNHLENAIYMGGPYVFQVSMRLPYDHTYWEYVSKNKIRANRIVRLTYHRKKELFKNDKLGTRIFKFNLKETLGKRYRSHAAKCGAIKRYANSKGKQEFKVKVAKASKQKEPSPL